MRNVRPSTVDRLWRLAVRRLAARPGVLTAGLAAIRSQAAARVLERHRPRAAALARPLAEGAEEARAELSKIAEEALAQMRSEVGLLARRSGLARAFMEAVDRRWTRPEARELMDDPDLDAGLRSEILHRLDHFNTGFGSYDDFVAELHPLLDPARPTRLLDLASGHAGFALATARAARDAGIELEVTASDIRREYLDLGEAAARREGLSVRFLVQDARDLSGLGRGRFDVVTCTQSLHHLPPGLIAVMFEAAVRAAGRGVVFIDGSRSLRTGLGLGLYVLLRYRHRAFVHDTWISTRRFLVAEELALLARLGPWGDRAVASWSAPGFCVLRRSR